MTPVIIEMIVPADLALVAWVVTLWRIAAEPRRSGHGLPLYGGLG